MRIPMRSQMARERTGKCLECWAVNGCVSSRCLRWSSGIIADLVKVWRSGGAWHGMTLRLQYFKLVRRE